MYVERQRKWIKEVGLEIGDKVLIVAKASDEQGGWDDSWVEQMDGEIGLVGIVVADSPDSPDDADGIRVQTATGTWNYPFFVLVKVEE